MAKVLVAVKTPVEAFADDAVPSTVDEDEKRHAVNHDEAGATHATSATDTTPESKSPIRLLAAVPMGIIFGFALQKGRVYEPIVIRRQFVLEDWTMLIMFLAAAGTSAVIFGAFAALRPAQMQEVRARFECGCRQSLVCGVGGGGVVLGGGMVLSGACPGMVLAQLGAGVPNSLVTLAGALAGSLAFGVAERPLLRPLLQPGDGDAGDGGNAAPRIPRVPPFVDGFTRRASFAPLAVGAGVLFLGISALLDVFVGRAAACPSAEVGVGGLPFGCAAWRASVAGVVVGGLQLLCALAFHDSLGSSSAYMTAVGVAVANVPAKLRATACFKPVSEARFGAAWWQLLYVLAAVGGAALAAATQNEPLGVLGVDVPSAFCGGFLMLFGSRMAGGCTSGHGLSGMGLLATASFVAVPAMFGGGIAVGFAMGAGDASKLVT